MSQLSREQIKQYYETGDRPTQAQFGDFIDSAKWYDEGGTTDVEQLYSLLGYTGKGETIGLNVMRASGSLTLADQQIRFTPVKIPASGNITGFKWVQLTQGNYTGNNENRLGLYSFDSLTGLLTLVAATENDSELWKVSSATAGQKGLSSVYAATSGIYWVAAIYCRSASVTPPALCCGPVALAAAIMEVGFTLGYKPVMLLNTQTSLPVTVNMSALTRSGNPFYIQLY